MKAKYHAGISLVFAWWIFTTFRSWEFALATIIAGIFTDIDHFFDYFLEYGWRFNTDHFFRSFNEGRYKHVYLLFHGWEWAILLLIITYTSDFYEPILGILCGYMLHMILDQIFNQATPWSYSLIWRWRRKFEFRRIFLHGPNESL